MRCNAKTGIGVSNRRNAEGRYCAVCVCDRADEHNEHRCRTCGWRW